MKTCFKLNSGFLKTETLYFYTVLIYKQIRVSMTIQIAKKCNKPNNNANHKTDPA